MIKLLMVVIGKGGAGKLCFPYLGKDFWFLLFSGLWFSWKPTFYYFYSLTFKFASLAKSHIDSFSWPERYYLQASISFGGGERGSLLFCSKLFALDYVWATFCSLFYYP